MFVSHPKIFTEQSVVFPKYSTMNCDVKYANFTSITINDMRYFLETYGNFLKWKDHKETVIEVGCADGSVTREALFPFLKDRIKTLEAIDKLEPMIKHANDVKGTKNIQFEVKNILDREYIESKKGKVDHIFSFYTAHFMPDTRSLLKVFHEMLTPNGQIFITTLHSCPTLSSFRKHSDEGTWDKYLPKKEYFANYSSNPKEHMSSILEDIGFQVDLCTVVNRTSVTEYYKDFIRCLIRLCDFLADIPVELQEEYVEDHVKNSCEPCVYLGEPDKYQFQYDVIMIIASKKSL